MKGQRVDMTGFSPDLWNLFGNTIWISDDIPIGSFPKFIQVVGATNTNLCIFTYHLLQRKTKEEQFRENMSINGQRFLNSLQPDSYNLFIRDVVMDGKPIPPMVLNKIRKQDQHAFIHDVNESLKKFDPTLAKLTENDRLLDVESLQVFKPVPRESTVGCYKPALASRGRPMLRLGTEKYTLFSEVPKKQRWIFHPMELETESSTEGSTESAKPGASHVLLFDVEYRF
jgi:hypothetical protein